MPRRYAAAALLLFALLSPTLLAIAQQPTPTPASQTNVTPALDVVARIKDEGINRSQIMETLDYLTNVIGPRLTGSPALKRANNWTRERLTGWGLQNSHLEAWGPFGRGWTLKRFSAEVVAPQTFPMLAYPRAWSPGLDAPLTADVVLVDAKNEEELQKYKGTLRGKIVLTGALRELKPGFEPAAKRLSEKELLELADAPDPATLAARPPRAPRTPEQIATAKFNDRKTQFYYDEGAALLVGSSPAGDGGMLQFVQSASVPQPFDTPFDKRIGAWDARAPKLIPQIAVSNDHYNRLVRMIQQGEKIQLAVNLQVEFNDDDSMSYNTVAEIPGGDLKDEVVMLGGHLDSWHTATGATDNAAGASVMMEAIRILQALKLQPRRTIRIALWSGEEQGLLGSSAYVKDHFGPVPAPAIAAATKDAAQPDAAAAVAQKTGRTPQKRDASVEAAKTKTPVVTPPTNTTASVNATSQAQATRFKPEYDKLSVYFNLDSGTGAVRGIYLQGNESLRPIFRQWLEPFREFQVGTNKYNASTISVANTGGSDFLSFNAVGLNGFDFMQDEIEYETRTWHTNLDTYDRIIPEDVKEAAVIVATFAYNAAMADEKLPRKPFKETRTRF